MFVVLLKFSKNKGGAGEYMDGHNHWLKQGFDDGVFLLAGNLGPGQGGSVIAHNTTLAELQARVNADPFVEHDVVTAEILDIEPKKTDERLSFLVG